MGTIREHASPVAARGRAADSPRRAASSEERASDCWPDWDSPPDDAETRAFAEKNKPWAVLGEAGRVLAITALVIFAIELSLHLFHAI